MYKTVLFFTIRISLVWPNVERHMLLFPDLLKKGQVLVGKKFLQQDYASQNNYDRRHESTAEENFKSYHKNKIQIFRHLINFELVQS